MSADVFAELSPPYSTILADPPWGYEERTAPWRSNVDNTYSLMTTAEIAGLPVNAISAPDAHLYLWTTLPMMATAYKVVERWGFTPDTLLTWCKPGPGLGGGFRGNTEHLIVARRGFSFINPTCADCGGRTRGANKCFCARPAWRYKGEPVLDDAKRPFQATAEGTWFKAPRSAHSAKPALFADLVERMSPGPYVELFARAPRLGWDSWGNGYEIGAAS